MNDQDRIDTTDCPVCFEKIHPRSKKCKSCGSFLDWRRYMSFGNTFLGLLVAALSIFTIIRPIVNQLTKEEDSHLAFSLGNIDTYLNSGERMPIGSIKLAEGLSDLRIHMQVMGWPDRLLLGDASYTRQLIQNSSIANDELKKFHRELIDSHEFSRKGLILGFTCINPSTLSGFLRESEVLFSHGDSSVSIKFKLFPEPHELHIDGEVPAGTSKRIKMYSYVDSWQLLVKGKPIEWAKISPEFFMSAALKLSIKYLSFRGELFDFEMSFMDKLELRTRLVGRMTILDKYKSNNLSLFISDQYSPIICPEFIID